MPLASGVHQRILSILDGTASHQEVHELVLLCQALARAFLTKRSSSQYLARLQGLNRDDLACDCIAELFARDEAGVYVELRAYFAGYGVAGMSCEDTLFHLQRLVASKTHQSIVRLFAEADPGLAKILRNIKGSIHSLKSFIDVERFGEAYIVPAFSEGLEHLSQFDAEGLEAALMEILSGDEFIPEALGKLALFLRQQDEQCRLVPLMMVAQALRCAYERKNCLRLPGATTEVDDSRMDREAIVEQSLEAVRADAKTRYVGKGKLSGELLDVYFEVIAEGLQKRYVEGDGEEFSLYGSLAKRMPSLTREEYGRTHKSRLEYLSKLTFHSVLKHMRR